MKRVPGVSYIELFVSMTIFAMLSMMAMPNFIGWREREDFKSEVNAIFQTINDARVNALSERTCVKPDGTIAPTVGWSVVLERNQMTLRCHRDGGFGTEFTTDTVIPYTSSLMINQYALHYYNDHFYNSIFYDLTRGPEQLDLVNANGADVSTPAANPSSLVVRFAPGTGECSLGSSPEIRGLLLPMYLPGDATALKKFICLDRIAGVPYFCTDVITQSFIDTYNLTE